MFIRKKVNINMLKSKGSGGDTSQKKIHDIDEVIEVFGKFQIIQYTLIFLATVFITMMDINYVFVAGDVNYRCLVPECEGENITAGHPQWWPSFASDRCTKPVLRSDVQPGHCLNTSFTEELEECTEWIYESNDTVVAELDLACQPWKLNLIGTIHSVGMLFSMFVFGWAADMFGRKPALVICYVGSCIGHVKVLMTSWPAYVAIEFLESCMSGGSYTAAMVLMLEICGKDKRILSGVLFSYFIYFGESMFACIAMFVPHWKNLVHIIYTPFIFFSCYIFLLHESPRWQIVSGKPDDAINTMKLFAKMNNTAINYEDWQTLDGAKLKEKFNIEEKSINETFGTVFKSKEILVRLFVSCICRFTVSFVYYGLMLNSVWLPGDKYVNFLLSTLMSFPGELISLYLMNKIGRKLPLMVGFVLSGLLCIVSGYVPVSYTWIKISLFLFSKMIISACFTGILTYTMELVPTSARGSLLGITSFSSRVGGMLAPLTPILNSISDVLPTILFGISAIISGILLVLTPETRDLPLMDTVRQIEESVKTAKELKNSYQERCERS